MLLSLGVLPHLQCAAITHVERHIEDDQKADISNSAMLFQNARDEVGGEAHQRDGKSAVSDCEEIISSIRATPF